MTYSIKHIIAVLFISLLVTSCNTGTKQPAEQDGSVVEEVFRPAFHFTPDSGWMNDPNGLVYVDGEYHMFFQHNPDSNVWGPMHWGHAVSTDLFHWEQRPIALFPDPLGTIFSGSIVVDKSNSAGFGEHALVAIFTHHNQQLESENTGLHQYQSLAYSIDKGQTWQKYEGNPVLPNPGIQDFRDPKVIWHEASKKWVMVLATQQTISFYTSPDLKQWSKGGEFGQGVGAHGGVWECPDLLEFQTAEGNKWVLLVSINPGGPNEGSATQYFVGDFDGRTFTSDQQDAMWMDYGPDNYAGVTFSNTGDQHILVGWMSNWAYANEVPASTWRSGMTIARQLNLRKMDKRWALQSTPVSSLRKVSSPQELDVKQLVEEQVEVASRFHLTGTFPADEDFEFALRTAEQESTLLFGYRKAENEFYLDRSGTVHVPFNDMFLKVATAPRASQEKMIPYHIVIDKNSIEIFADQGTTNLTGIFFVSHPLTHLSLRTNSAPEEVAYSEIAQTVRN